MLKKRRKAGLLAFIIILSFLEGCGTEEEPEQERLAPTSCAGEGTIRTLRPGKKELGGSLAGFR